MVGRHDRGAHRSGGQLDLRVGHEHGLCRIRQFSLVHDRVADPGDDVADAILEDGRAALVPDPFETGAEGGRE